MYIKLGQGFGGQSRTPPGPDPGIRHNDKGRPPQLVLPPGSWGQLIYFHWCPQLFSNICLTTCGLAPPSWPPSILPSNSLPIQTLKFTTVRYPDHGALDIFNPPGARLGRQKDARQARMPRLQQPSRAVQRHGGPPLRQLRVGRRDVRNHPLPPRPVSLCIFVSLPLTPKLTTSPDIRVGRVEAPPPPPPPPSTHHQMPSPPPLAAAREPPQVPAAPTSQPRT